MTLGWRAELNRLAAAAGPQTDEAWRATVDDAAKVSAAVATLEMAVDAGLITDEIWLTSQDHWPSEVAEALQRISPDVDLHALRFLHGQHLQGWVNNVTGTVFELHAQHLTSGLPHGATALRLASRTQEGWDAELLRSGHVVGHVQMKASMTDDIIRDHLHHFPTLQDVVTTHEAAQAATHHGLSHVVDSHIAYGDVHDPTAAALSDHWGVSHFVHEWVPIVSLAVVGVGYIKLRRDGQSSEAARAWAVHQAKLAGVANAAGTIAVVATHHPLVRIPTVLLTRFSAGRRDVASALASGVLRQRQLLLGIADAG